MISQSEITYDVFISDPIPQAIATLLPNGDHPIWSPISALCWLPALVYPLLPYCAYIGSYYSTLR